ncbi:uncharacterized protein AAG666_002673 isoform 2-T2 [Megaptera novaeangliae]
MVQRGRDQLVDILLIGWWGGKWESASSTFRFHPVWGLRACGQQTVNFSHLVTVSVPAKQLKGWDKRLLMQIKKTGEMDADLWITNDQNRRLSPTAREFELHLAVLLCALIPNKGYPFNLSLSCCATRWNQQIHTCGVFARIHGHVRSGEKCSQHGQHEWLRLKLLCICNWSSCGAPGIQLWWGNHITIREAVLIKTVFY